MRTFAFCLIFFLPIFVLGQNKYYDVVTLKNGSVIKGMITERSEDGSITMLLGGRQTVSFFAEEIDSIDKSGKVDQKKLPDHKGYFSRTEMGTSFKKERNWDGKYTTVYPWFQTVHGYEWSRFLQTGIGVGTDFYEDVVTVPFYFHLSGELLNSKVTPIYLIQFGDSFVINGGPLEFRNDNNSKGKGFFRIGTGIQINSPINSFYLTVGFKVNKVVYSNNSDFTPYRWSTESSRKYRSFSVGFGMKF